jgi:predicted RNase H-like HicB family nuclease
LSFVLAIGKLPLPSDAYRDLAEVPVLDLPLVNTPTPMKTTRELTAIIEREGDGYVALCPEVDVASQGDTVEEARSNLIEALELFFETASPNELLERLHEEVLITRVKVAV